MTPNRFLLDDLARCTRLPIRKLRYVVDDAEMIQAADVGQKAARGCPRTFSLGLGVIVVGAAHLLQQGVRREAVRIYTHHLQNAAWLPTRGRKGRSAGADALSTLLADSDRRSLRVQFADELNVRLVGEQYTTGWLQASTGATLAKKYAPLVVVELDLGAIRDAILA